MRVERFGHLYRSREKTLHLQRRGGEAAMNEVAEEIRLEEEAKKNTAVSDLVDFIRDLDGSVQDLFARIERLELEVQRLRDDVNYLLTKI